VYRIDFLTTTGWEAGGPAKPVQGAQPTGALITFPNSEVLHTNITNYIRDFPYVWDEVTVGVGSDSDLEYAARLVEETAYATLGKAMAGPAAAYETLLRAAELDFDISARPQVYVTLTDSWSNLTVRYLVAARERRLWSSRLFVALSSAIGGAEPAPKVRPALPRRQVELLGGEERR
jgi:small conductance mechanosensitive channel